MISAFWKSIVHLHHTDEYSPYWILISKKKFLWDKSAEDTLHVSALRASKICITAKDMLAALVKRTYLWEWLHPPLYGRTSSERSNVGMVAHSNALLCGDVSAPEALKIIVKKKPQTGADIIILCRKSAAGSCSEGRAEVPRRASNCWDAQEIHQALPYPQSLPVERGFGYQKAYY